MENEDKEIGDLEVENADKEGENLEVEKEKGGDAEKTKEPLSFSKHVPRKKNAPS